MRERIIIYTIMVCVIPIAGEFRIFQLEGTMRVSLGTPVFFFFLLWSKKVQPVSAGLTAGISVTLFRTFLSAISSNNIGLGDGFLLNFPVFFYYFVYGTLFQIFKVRSKMDHSIIVGFLGTIIEVISSIIELFFRAYFIQDTFSIKKMFLIVVIALIRSFFVLLLFNNLILYEVKKAEKERRKRTEKMLVNTSNLYVELVQLKKSMQNTEQLTKDCYDLYRELIREKSPNGISKKALQIAGKVHDIKKDHQRIYAGLRKLIKREKITDLMEIDDILNVVISSNSSYSDLLGKSIHFSTIVWGNQEKYHAFSLLSIINNLVSNAVESIEKTGHIAINAIRDSNLLMIKVSDDGPGILKENRDLVFLPGFTTKFDSTGNSSTGIGLSYVKDFVEQLGGTMKLECDDDSHVTTFILTIPVKHLNESGR